VWAWLTLAATAALGMAVIVVAGRARCARSIAPTSATIGPQDGLPVSMACVVVAVVAVMAVVLAALHDVSLDTPRQPA
jgi:hypothetical protein